MKNLGVFCGSHSGRGEVYRSAAAGFAREVMAGIVGPENAIAQEPTMGAEDFSFMLQVKPGAYLRIGQGGEGSCFLHNSRYDFNDDILPLGSALHAGLIEQSMPLAGPVHHA